MTTAQEILKLIETVDPSDTAILDKIDVHVSCYIHGWNYSKDMTRDFRRTRENDPQYFSENYKEYTRSRDALRAIRPEGWTGHILIFEREARCVLSEPYTGNFCGTFDFKTEEYIGDKIFAGLPTEELAELYAVIQAIEYERNKK